MSTAKNSRLLWVRFDRMPTEDALNLVIQDAVSFFDNPQSVATVRIYWGTCRETGATLWSYQIGPDRFGGSSLRTCDTVHCVAKAVTWLDLHGMHHMGGCGPEYARHILRVIQETR